MCVQESQIKLLFISGAGDYYKRQPTFIVVIYYTMQFILKSGNAILTICECVVRCESM